MRTDFAGGSGGQGDAQAFADVGLLPKADAQFDVSAGALKDAGSAPDGEREPTRSSDDARETPLRCNNVENLASLHEVVNVDGDAPTPVGGAVEDGTYHETAAQFYDTGAPVGSTGLQRRMVLVIAGTLLQAAFVTRYQGQETEQTESDDFRAATDAGVGMAELTQTCPAATGQAIPLGYSVFGKGTGATLMFHFPTITLQSGGTGSSVLTLTRQ
jgi:hypothetical protein